MPRYLLDIANIVGPNLPPYQSTCTSIPCNLVLFEESDLWNYIHSHLHVILDGQLLLSLFSRGVLVIKNCRLCCDLNDWVKVEMSTYDAIVVNI